MLCASASASSLSTAPYEMPSQKRLLLIIFSIFILELHHNCSKAFTCLADQALKRMAKTSYAACSILIQSNETCFGWCNVGASFTYLSRLKRIPGLLYLTKFWVAKIYHKWWGAIQGDEVPQQALYTDTWRFVIPEVYFRCPGCPMALNATVTAAPKTRIDPSHGVLTSGALPESPCDFYFHAHDC